MSTIKTLHDQSMLAYISVSVWTARKLDQRATKKLTTDAGATSDAARVNKHLLADADSGLKELSRLGSEARRTVDELTMPWDDAGNRLLPNNHVMKLIAAVADVKCRFDAAVDRFITDYPQLREHALQSLGTLADESAYPTADVVRDKFVMRLSLSPLPASFGDIRTGMAPKQVAALEAHFASRTQESIDRALTAAWDRLRDQVTALRDRLEAVSSGQRTQLRDALFSNIRLTCDLLSDVGALGSPAVLAVRDSVLKLLVASPDVLRNDADQAHKVMTAADAVLARMQGGV